MTNEMDTSKLLVSLPNFLLEEVHETGAEANMSKAEVVRDALLVYLTSDFTTNEELQGKMEKWKELVKSKRSRAGSSPRLINYSENRLIIKGLLRESKEPVTLRYLSDRLGSTRKVVTRILEKYEGKAWTIYRPDKEKERGKPWQIALKDSDAEKIVKKLINAQIKDSEQQLAKNERKNKRRKKKKKAVVDND